MLQPPTVGIIANPLSGRDVRRVAARGGVSSPQDKRNRIARAVVGAVNAGARRVLLMHEPFEISTGAVADLHLDADIEVIDVEARLDAGDTERATRTMREEGVGALIVLGGDGTNRIIARTWPGCVLVPMSTGTNNVFPTMVEATVAGAAAGLVVSGAVPTDEVAPRAKVVEVGAGETSGPDLALIDAVHLVDDFVGNKMPYEPDSIRTLVLARAEPAAIGVSSIGGLSLPCPADADHGVLVRCGPGGHALRAPLAPGLYRTVHVISATELPLGMAVDVEPPGILAFDGDREIRLSEGPATLTVTRNGPRVVDVARAMAWAAESGVFLSPVAESRDHNLI